MNRHPRVTIHLLTLVGGLACGLCSVAAAVSFAPHVDYPTGTRPSAVAIGDLNGDGKLDLVVSNDGSDYVSVLLGNGDGTYGAATNFLTLHFPDGLAIGDLNGDGKLDWVTANYGSSSASRRLGIGNGSFGAISNFPTANNPRSVAIGDLNGDGKPDLVTEGSKVSVLLGNGDGTFGGYADVFPGTILGFDHEVAIGDLNGDGKPDLVAAGSFNVEVLLGNGDGTFHLGGYYLGGGASSVAIGDLNRDGKLDFVAAFNANSTVSVLLGNGDGSFGAATSFGTWINPKSVAIGDLNKDGNPDLAVACGGGSNPGYISVLLGDGTGAFGINTDFSTGSTAFSVAIGDLDGDTRPDLAVAGDGVEVLINTTPVVSFDPGPTPVDFGLSQILPNPTSAVAHMDFTVPREAKIRLSIMDLQGRNVAELADGTFGPGRHEATWSTRSDEGPVPNGVYFVEYQAPGKVIMKRIVVAR